MRLPRNTTRHFAASALAAALAVVVAAGMAAPRAAAQCGCMDVALVIDDSGSMGGAINSVKSELPAIVSAALSASGGNVRFGLVTFPNVAGGTNDGITVRQPFTTDAAGFEAAVQALTATGGNAEPDSSDTALELVVTGSTASSCTVTNGPLGGFRPECAKIAVLITDAHPGGCDDTFTVGVDDVHAHNVAVAAANAGVAVSAIYVPTTGVVGEIRDIMEDYVDTSGGIFVQSESTGEGTGQGIADILASCGGQGGVCVTRNARFWFTHAVPVETNCVSLLGAFEVNGGSVGLGFIRLPTTFRDADNELGAVDGLIEALGLYYRNLGRTGEPTGTQSDGALASRLCRERKKLARELIAATANARLFRTSPGNCTYVNGSSVTNFPRDLLAQARTVAAGFDPAACQAMTALLKKFNQSGVTNDFPGNLVECSPDKKTVLRQTGRDPTTQTSCPGINNSCETAETLFSFPYSRSVNLTKYTDAFQSPSCGSGGADAVWRIAPPVAAANRNFLINTRGSNFDTLVSVWSGDDCTNLTEVACSATANGLTPTNQLQFTSSGTNTYFIVIEGQSAATGTLKVKVTSF
jgi:hypothetical protein